MWTLRSSPSAGSAAEGQGPQRTRNMRLHVHIISILDWKYNMIAAAIFAFKVGSHV